MLIEERRRKVRALIRKLDKKERTNLLIKAGVLDEDGNLHRRFQVKEEVKEEQKAVSKSIEL